MGSARGAQSPPNRDELAILHARRPHLDPPKGKQQGRNGGSLPLAASQVWRKSRMGKERNMRNRENLEPKSKKEANEASINVYKEQLEGKTGCGLGSFIKQCFGYANHPKAVLGPGEYIMRDPETGKVLSRDDAHAAWKEINVTPERVNNPQWFVRGARDGKRMVGIAYRWAPTPPREEIPKESSENKETKMRN